MEFLNDDISRQAYRKSFSRFTVAANIPFREPKNFVEGSSKSKINELAKHSLNAKKTKRKLLTKKTIHSSLENLHRLGNNKGVTLNHSTSAENTQTCPSPVQETAAKAVSPKPTLTHEISKVDHPYATIMSEVLPTKDEVSNNTWGSTDDGSGDFPGRNHDMQCDDSEFQSDSHENISISSEKEMLLELLKEQRKKWILCKTLYVIVFKALQKRSMELTETEMKLKERREECAARLILHHLLLNSWKTTKAQVAAISTENTQMHKTIDNQSLQLNIIRKMQAIEKEKAAVILKDYNEVKGKYHQAVQDNQIIKEEYAKVLGEKRSLESRLEILRDEHSRLNVDLRIKLDKKEMLIKSMEMDRFRAERFSRENEQLLKEAAQSKNLIRELTLQQAHWQEKAIKCESQCYELRLELQSKLDGCEKAMNENKEFSQEKEILTLSKNKLERAVLEAQTKLEETTNQKEKLEKAYNECKDELDDLEDQVQYLQTTLRRYKKENSDIRQKLYNCTLQNVQKRRVWGSALYFLVNPIEAFKKLYFGNPVNATDVRGHRQQKETPRIEHTEALVNVT